MKRFQHYIDGQFEDGNASFASLDPATGSAWAQMPAATAADVDRDGPRKTALPFG